MSVIILNGKPKGETSSFNFGLGGPIVIDLDKELVKQCKLTAGLKRLGKALAKQQRRLGVKMIAIEIQYVNDLVPGWADKEII